MLWRKQLNNNITIGGLTTILILILSPVLDTYSQTSNSTDAINTFMDCYSRNVGNLFLGQIFLPLTIDFNDLKFKKFLSYICNFFYEKTGIWPDISRDDYLFDKYGKEFWEGYSLDQVPQDIIELWKLRSNNNNTKIN